MLNIRVSLKSAIETLCIVYKALCKNLVCTRKTLCSTKNSLFATKKLLYLHVNKLVENVFN